MVSNTDERRDESDGSERASWAALRAPRELRAGETHVWRARSLLPAAALDALWPLLDAHEQERARRLPAARPRAAFIAVRGTLRKLLAAYLGEHAGALRFAYGALGKPQLAGGVAHDLRFSITHSGELALIAIGSASSIGVDAERERQPRRLDRIARRVFATATSRLLETLPAEERARAFLAAWTQREAYVKAVGGGMLRSADVLPFVWPRPPHPVEVEPLQAAGEAGVWTVAPLQAAPGYVATLVAAGTPHDVHCYDATAIQR